MSNPYEHCVFVCQNLFVLEEDLGLKKGSYQTFIFVVKNVPKSE